MTLFVSLCSVLAIVVYSVSMGLCFMLYGKTGKKVLQYAGFLMFVYVFEAVYVTVQGLLSLRYSSHTLVLAIMLAFNILETYFLGRIIYVIFQRAISAAFYIWLCVIIMINGLISPFPVDLSLWLFFAFNISVVAICVIYWDALVRETGTELHAEASKFSNIILILAIYAIAILAYSITNLSLFQKLPSRNFIDLFGLFFDLIVSVWFIQFCQREYEAHTSQPIKHAFQPLPDMPQPEAPEDPITGSLDQLESFRTQYELTDRETEILQLVLAGKSNQEISDELFITVGTVKAHIHSIFGKLDVSRRSQLMTRFLDHDMNK